MYGRTSVQLLYTCRFVVELKIGEFIKCAEAIAARLTCSEISLRNFGETWKDLPNQSELDANVMGEVIALQLPLNCVCKTANETFRYYHDTAYVLLIT